MLFGSFAAAQATNYKGKSDLPWWALIVLLLMSFILLVIYGYVLLSLSLHISPEVHSKVLGVHHRLPAFVVRKRLLPGMHNNVFSHV